MASGGGDDLARTATMQADGAVTQAAAAPGTTLGRYRLERELGAGGMGVVHAAFDPDLERRVALKVLRVATPSLEARDRLMREARAMARLSHPNVITVHEVGTAGGRDFVAMELIQGENLADWLRAASRPIGSILEAFVAAGRGLAAAHAAGIVHRDFKPHNVLRSRAGRIVVTDFGLAREAQGGAIALEATLPVGAALAAGASSSAPSALAGLTMTGALLGTPAYMAPEQWRGDAVTPATDQFAYCVALWEAIAGERPYPGPSLEELRVQAAGGPTALDASRIPRRLRPILRRGLDPAPARRWPSMDALLAGLVRVERRPAVAVALAVMATAVVVGLLVRGGAAPEPACAPPGREVSGVWSPAIAAELRGRGLDGHAAVLDAAFRGWQAARAEACRAPAQVQRDQLQCLDGVLARFDALRKADTRAAAPDAEAIQRQLIDPAICRKDSAAELPRLTLTFSADVIAAYELYARSDADDARARPTEAELGALLARPELDRCARVIATLAFATVSHDGPRIRGLLEDAKSMADQCGDDRLRADLLIEAAPHLAEPVIGARGEAARSQAQVAAARVMQPDLAARLALQQAKIARQAQQLDEAIRLVGTAIEGFGARGLEILQARAILDRNRLRFVRAGTGDYDAVIADAAAWRVIAARHHQDRLVLRIDGQAAAARYWRGDVAGAHDELVRLSQADAEPPATGRTITGEVVDVRGRPVPGATVATAEFLRSDSVGVGVPIDSDAGLQRATTDASGRFSFRIAASTGAIAAQLGDQRSLPAPLTDRVRLALAPTRRITGTVDRSSAPHARLRVYCIPDTDSTGRFNLIAPVAADGSFVLDGAPTTGMVVGVESGDEGLGGRAEQRIYPASRSPLTGVALAFSPANRAIDVIVRSAIAARLQVAQVIVFVGKHRITNFGELIQARSTSMQQEFARPASAEQATALGKLRAGDAVAHIAHVPSGGLTVCAFDFGIDLADPVAVQRLEEHMHQFAFKCEYLARGDSSIVVVVPPQQRFD